MHVSSIPLSPNPDANTLRQIDNHPLSLPTENLLQKIKNTLTVLAKSLHYLTLAKETIIRIFNAILNSIFGKFATKNSPRDATANAAINSVEVHDIEALNSAIHKFGQARGLHITFAPDFNFPENSADFAALLSDTQVASLIFDKCPFLTDEHLRAVFQKCTNLEELKLESCYNIRGNFLQHIPTTVKILEIFHCTQIMLDNPIDGLKRCTNLQKLSIRNWPCVEKSSFLQHIPTTVKILEVSNFAQLIEQDLKVVVERCTDLESLVVSDCPHIKGSFLEYSPATLKKLHLSGCQYFIGIKSQDVIKEKYPNVIFHKKNDNADSNNAEITFITFKRI